MYIPAAFEEQDVSVMHSLMREHPLATLVTQSDEGSVANHIPFVLDSGRGSYGTLRGHVARANPVWQTSFATGAALVVFQGPQAYVTPSWYPTKRLNGEVVPTWNYTAVHAHGIPGVIQDHDWLLALVGDLTALHEAREAHPWSVTDAPREFVDRLLGNIVGIEIPIERLVGKWKVSQNRPEADRRAVAEGLEARTGEDAKATGTLVRRRISRTAG
jgi:transcriptional regulator